MIIGTSRVVDSGLSPAFLAIRNTREKLREAGSHCSNIYIPNLKNTLEDLFDNGTASPFDMDCNGITLFHVSKTSVPHDFIKRQY